jgi:hypothetical protein
MSETNFATPPPPAAPAAPTMSTPATLANIFFDPGETFEALRARPRFLVAGLIFILAFMAYYAAFVQRVGAENIVRAQITARSPDAPPEQVEQAVKLQTSPVVQAITYGAFPLVFALIFAAGAGLYLLGATATAKGMSYKQALAVWVYSSLPPMLASALVNILLLFLKPVDDIDPNAINTGLARANLGLLVSVKEHPVLATLLGSFDVFAFYGLFLAALGLRKVARLSTGAAWTIVLAVWLVSVILRVAGAAFFGAAS